MLLARLTFIWGIVLFAIVTNVQADMITLSATAQGYWSSVEAGDNTGTDNNYLTGSIGARDFNSFFTFDISSLSTDDVITSATLKLTRYDSLLSGPTETLAFYDVSTPTATLINKNGSNPTIHLDLETNTNYGMFGVPVTGAPDDVLEFILNPAAIADLNAAIGGFFSIGGYLASDDGGDRIFVNSGGSDPQILELTVEPQMPPTAPVPEPTSLVTFGLCGLVLAFVVRRKKTAVAR